MDACIDNIFEINRYEDLFWSWINLDIDGCRAHIISLMQDEINIPKLLSLCKELGVQVIIREDGHLMRIILLDL